MLGSTVSAIAGSCATHACLVDHPRGALGAGETRLADALAELAHERDARVGWARSCQGAGPYGVVLEALRSARSDLRALPASSRARDETFEALRADLEALGPSALVLDDVHGADLDSLAFLRWLAPRLRSASALLVATGRSVATGASPEAAALLAELAHDAVTVALGGLDAAAVGELIAAATGRATDPRMAEAVQRATLGNALFVHGVVRDAARAGSLDVGTLSFPRDLQHAVALRVAAAGPDAALDLLETHAPADRSSRLRVTLALGDDLLRAGRRGDARAAHLDAAALARSLADRDGKLAGLRNYQDAASILRQIGAA